MKILVTTLAIVLSIGGTQAGWDDIPPGNVEVRPAPPNWKPRPVWAPNGMAPAGYISPLVLMQLEENQQNPHFVGALLPDPKPPMWMGIGLPKWKLDALQPLSPAVASPAATQAGFRYDRGHIFPAKPVKTETIRGDVTDPHYARYQKVWTFPVPDRAIPIPAPRPPDQR
jgi:hypothetical protein